MLKRGDRTYAWKRGKVKRGQEGPDAKEAVLTQREVTRTEWGGVVTPEAGSGSGHVVGVKDSIHVSSKPVRQFRWT